MNKGIVAIVGRPNVGKSTLFNKLAGKKISIVEDTPGVTRDRIYAEASWLSYNFTIIDTGGIETSTQDNIMRQMMQQSEIAIDTADVILFITDLKQGVTDEDEQVANVLRKANKPVLLIVNKADNVGKKSLDHFEFYSLGIGDPILVSAEHSLGMDDLLDEIIKYLPSSLDDENEEELVRTAIIGRPNAGKSSLINKILNENRHIVSDIPGTTRDAVDSAFKRNGIKYLFTDTAGIRKKSKIKENIEHYSIVRAVAAIERSDVCVILIDANEGVTEQDTKISGIANDRGKASIICINKWDVYEKDTKTMNKYTKDIEFKLSYMNYAPKIFISALTGQRVNNLLNLINTVSQNHSLRIQTGMLNDVLIEATAMNQPPSDKGKQLKIYYITQVSVKPPTFVLFINDKELMHFSYKRYIENQLRQAFGFEGTPIRFILKEKKEK